MILVTGGTGFVGSEVVRRLVEVGHRVRILTRDKKRVAQAGPGKGVELAEGDVTRPETLAAAMDGVEAVIHLVGIIVETPSVSFDDVHHQGTRNVVKSAQEAGVQRVVMVSAAGTRPHAASAYHRTKFQGEQALRESGLSYTILRPSVIYGPEDHLVQALAMLFRFPFDVLRARLQPLMAGGENLVQPVHVRDVAEAVSRSLVSPVSVGKTYDVVSESPYTWRQVFQRILSELGQPSFYEVLPVQTTLRLLCLTLIPLIPLVGLIVLLCGVMNEAAFIALFSTWVLALFGAFAVRTWILFYVPTPPLCWLALAGDQILPRALRFSQQLAMMEEDNIGDPAPLAEDLGMTPTPLEEGLSESLQGFHR